MPIKNNQIKTTTATPKKGKHGEARTPPRRDHQKVTTQSNEAPARKKSKKRKPRNQAGREEVAR